MQVAGLALGARTSTTSQLAEEQRKATLSEHCSGWISLPDFYQVCVTVA